MGALRKCAQNVKLYYKKPAVKMFYKPAIKIRVGQIFKGVGSTS